MANNFRALYPSIRHDPNMQQEPVKWLVNGIWQKAKINAMGGFEKSGKSRLMNWLLVQAAQNERPLYLCGEEPVALVNNRITNYAALQGFKDYAFNIDYMMAAAMRLDFKSQRDELLQIMLDDDRTMLVIDPMRNIHGADENDSNAMSPIFNDMRRWTNVYGITIILLHHTPKLSEDADMSRIASWFRGSTALPAILDTAQYVNRINKSKIKILRQGRFPPLEPLQIEDLGGSRLNEDRGFQI